MSESFFSDLELPKPDKFLNSKSGSHAEQTAKIMVEFEKYCLSISPELVVVVGDINSTLACALVAAKLNIPIAHIESGLRSFDKKMPEEINRVLTDRLSDLLFVTEESGINNLKNEGIDHQKIHFVGNCMIDSLVKFLDESLSKSPWVKYGFQGNDYCLVTLHRPSNVDSKKNLNKIVKLLNEISFDIPIIFPIHPRTGLKLDITYH